MHTYIHTYIAYIYAKNAVMKAPLTEIKKLAEVYYWINQTTKAVFRDPVCGDGKYSMRMYVCIYVCMCVRNIITHTYVCTCIYVCVYVCVCIHI